LTKAPEEDATGAEIATLENYTAPRGDAPGFDGGNLKEIIEDAGVEYRNDLEALVSCIHELAGAP